MHARRAARGGRVRRPRSRHVRRRAAAGPGGRRRAWPPVPCRSTRRWPLPRPPRPARRDGPKKRGDEPAKTGFDRVRGAAVSPDGGRRGVRPREGSGPAPEPRTPPRPPPQAPPRSTARTEPRLRADVQPHDGRRPRRVQATPRMYFSIGRSSFFVTSSTSMRSPSMAVWTRHRRIAALPVSADVVNLSSNFVFRTLMGGSLGRRANSGRSR